MSRDVFDQWANAIGLQKGRADAWEGWQGRQPEIDVLKAEVERLRKDAARYQWACKQPHVAFMLEDGKEKIDEAIDAAMKEPK